MRIEFKLSDKDRATYGGPEWVLFDGEALAQMSYDELVALERPMLVEDRLTLTSLLSLHWPIHSMLGFRGAHWVARQLAGITEPGWSQFKPNGLTTDYRAVPEPGDVPAAEDDDADPPAGNS